MNKGFQEIARPFLVFYKQLSPYSKHTEKYLNEETIKFYNEINNESFPFEITYWVEDLFGNIINIQVNDGKSVISESACWQSIALFLFF